MDHHDEQVNEIEALDSIYCGDFESKKDKTALINPESYRLTHGKIFQLLALYLSTSSLFPFELTREKTMSVCRVP